MKKNFFLLLSLMVSNLKSQDFVTFYMPGYQLAGFKAKDVSISNASSQIRGDVKGKMGNWLLKGDCIVQNMVFTADVSQMLPITVHIFKPKKSNFYGAAFDTRLGGAFKLGSNSKIGAAFDLGFRGIQYYAPDVAVEYGFVTMGVSLVSLHRIDKIYIMPKLNLDPVFSKHTDKAVDGLSTKLEVSAGYKLLSKLGLSVSTGIERLKINYQTKVDRVEVIKPGKFTFYYLQVGLAFMLN